MLWRRYLSQKKASREAEGRQEADETRRPRRNSAGSVPGCAKNRDVGQRMKKSVFREYFESLIVAVILALFVRTWVFQAFKIPTGSMEPNLLVGDHLIVNKMTFSSVHRGDIVVFKFPKDPE